MVNIVYLVQFWWYDNIKQIELEPAKKEGLLTPQEMTNTPMLNLESFSYHTHRVSYGIDPVFTRLDKRRQRTFDVLLLRNPKPKITAENSRDEETMMKMITSDSSTTANTSKKGKNNKNKTPSNSKKMKN